ncbi:PREDICTED: uncharacterized protein LOC105971117 [Erythranthe guttata]|uniref:uncharacterized protein LOC105971117 n=1 Tax=Erythranthe guttata TaxID=4155 RepID=UPI00064D8B0E|nr:PREDICTED: uncharacterized protein LOC105971117 [Erythranthe guttata]|eukprot:XP_012851418.1 PREDICTED: uncharacterized protein LOC105971117 [Erythranthe guttata]
MENLDNINKGVMNNTVLTKGKSKNSGKINQQHSEGRSSARWNEFMNIKFIELCEEEIGKGNRPNSHFNSSGWKNLVRRFNEVTGKNYVYKQLRNHWDSMQKDWILFKKLMHQEIGIGWNPLTNSTEASDEWWAQKLRENGDYNKFRNKDLSLIWFRYDKLFSDIAATGERARAPNQRTNGEFNEVEEHVEIDDIDEMIILE